MQIDNCHVGKALECVFSPRQNCQMTLTTPICAALFAGTALALALTSTPVTVVNDTMTAATEASSEATYGAVTITAR